MVRSEITDPKGGACGFPSLRSLEQPDTLPQSPHGHHCEPDWEHSSLIKAQIGEFQRFHALRPICPRGFACSLPNQGAVGAPGSSEIPPDPQKAGGPEFSLCRFWGNWVGMEGRGVEMESEAPPVGGAEKSCLRNRTLEQSGSQEAPAHADVSRKGPEARFQPQPEHKPVLLHTTSPALSCSLGRREGRTDRDQDMEATAPSPGNGVVFGQLDCRLHFQLIIFISL